MFLARILEVHSVNIPNKGFSIIIVYDCSMNERKQKESLFDSGTELLHFNNWSIQ